ncbi:integrase core domain protein [Lasius niger]|uniref:RNA-directed DNA polymerase n=1 Tax=Lasius niger TaxID=67767 RepID=A0A0J7K777_LASNI|nr:integrase core domain protein [Lasius niger]
MGDPIISMFLQRKEINERPNLQEINRDISAKIYWSYWDALILKDGVLYKKWESPNLKSEIFQIIVPKDFISQVMEEAHDSASGGHFGVNKTLEKIRKRFYWATCKNDVEDWCRSCKVCVARRGPSGKGKSPLQVFDAVFPFERVQMDILGPLPTTTTGNRYLLVIIDCFTKWVEAFPLKNFKARTVADIFVKQFVSRHGVPLEVHTDQGKCFESKIFQEMTRLLGIKKTRTTALHPQSDGQVERHHQTILNYLTKFVSDDQKDWDDWISMYLLAYRSSKHEVTGASPAELYFARDLKLLLDLLRGSPPIDREDSFSEEYMQKLREKLDIIHKSARRRMNLQSLRSKIRYDRRVRKINFNVNQEVWLYNPRRVWGKSPKLQSN